MQLTILWSKKMVKAVARYDRAGNKNILVALDEVVHLLEIFDEHSMVILHDRFRDHVLKGNRKNMRELHLGQDDLLLYLVFKGQNTVVLENIVTHEELRKRK